MLFRWWEILERSMTADSVPRFSLSDFHPPAHVRNVTISIMKVWSWITVIKSHLERKNNVSSWQLRFFFFFFFFFLSPMTFGKLYITNANPIALTWWPLTSRAVAPRVNFFALKCYQPQNMYMQGELYHSCRSQSETRFKGARSKIPSEFPHVKPKSGTLRMRTQKRK